MTAAGQSSPDNFPHQMSHDLPEGAAEERLDILLSGLDISQGTAEERVGNLLNEVEKHLVILYLKRGGDRLYFYNQEMQVIRDANGLFAADKIYFTNEALAPNQQVFTGRIKMDQPIPIQAHPALFTKLIISHYGGIFAFWDERSLASWVGPLGVRDATARIA